MNINFMGLAESLIKLACLDWRLPDYSTLPRRHSHLGGVSPEAFERARA